MKVVIVMGTRPEVIRLSRVIERLDGLCELVLVHTGQNYDHTLNEVFFDEMGIRPPDHHLGARGSFGEQIGRILAESETLLRTLKPDRFLVLGDTNSSTAAFIAKRLGIPVLHMEAGNRCYDDRVPEEVNRRLIDHSSDVLMPYTERSRQNLLREGIPGERIFVTGNPICEVIEHYREPIENSKVLDTQGLEPKGYFLVTIHRAENVDVADRLRSIAVALARLSVEHRVPVIVSTHPHTRKRLEDHDVRIGAGDVRFMEPFGLFDFVRLERNARCVLTDSGTVQEESSIFGVPNVTVRDVTERPETLECGSNMLSGADPDLILAAVQAVLARAPAWQPPPEYVVPNVSDKVVRLVLGYHHSFRIREIR